MAEVRAALVVDSSARGTPCPCPGVYTDLVAQLGAVVPGPFQRRRVSVQRVCPDCHQRFALTLARTASRLDR